MPDSRHGAVSSTPQAATVTTATMLRTTHLGIRWLEESTLLNICTIGAVGGVLWHPFQDVGLRAGRLPPTSPADSGMLRRAGPGFGLVPWLRTGRLAYSIPHRGGDKCLEQGVAVGAALRRPMLQVCGGLFRGDALQGQAWWIARPTAAQPVLPDSRSVRCGDWLLWPPSHSGCPACCRPRSVPPRSDPGPAGPPARGRQSNGRWCRQVVVRTWRDPRSG